MIVAGRTLDHASLLIAMHRPLLGHAIAAALAGWPFIRVDVVTTPGPLAVTAAARTRPHVVLYDIGPGHGSGPVRELLDRSPESAVLVLGGASRSEPLRDYLAAGAVGYVDPSASVGELADAVVCAAAGRDAPDCDEPTSFVVRPTPLHRWRLDPGEPEMTAREHEVARLLAAGLSNAEIAARLGIRAPTVKAHVHHILTKLGVRRRGEVASHLSRRRPVRIEPARAASDARGFPAPPSRVVRRPWARHPPTWGSRR